MNCFIEDSLKKLRIGLLEFHVLPLKLCRDLFQGSKCVFQPFPVLIPGYMKTRNTLGKPAAGSPGIVTYSSTPV